MAARVEERQVYFIPKNFNWESRVFGGLVSVRRLVEGLVLGIPFIMLGMSLGKTLQARIILTILFTSPVVIAAMFGFNGDTFSATVRNVFAWRRSRGISLYDETARPFPRTPVETIYAEDPAMDKIVDKFDGMRRKRIDEHVSRKYERGVNFTFSEDGSLKRYYEADVPQAEEDVPRTEPVLEDISALDALYADSEWYVRSRRKALDIAADDDEEIP